MQAPPTRRPSRVPVAALVVVLAVVALALIGGFLLVPRAGQGRTEERADSQVAPTVQAPGAGDAGQAAPAAPAAFELRPQGAGPVRVELEIAATPEQRELGLMHRTKLAKGTGMVFLFPADDDGGFWMKNTLIPLSIAFVAADGRVVSVHEMVPCEADPCRVYRPAGLYRYAVELPAHAFPDAGIGPGDLVVPLDPGALPAAS